MSDKIVLIDGHSIMNRAYYGVPLLSNAEGFHTNAIYGFLNIMFKVLEDIRPAYFMVAFDLKAPTFRHKIYDAYKGTRKGMPDELREQIPVMQELLKAMRVPILTLEGYEADDILGTTAKRAEKDGLEVTIVSGDRDLLQLASDHICIRMPHTKGGKTEVDHFYAKDVLEKYQVTPLQIIELKALMGDSSDNIPGVPKVGEKTATELVKTFGSIENLKEHREEITKKSIRETLLENFELAELSKVLATIEINAPVEYDYHEAKLEDLYTPEAFAIIKKLEFKNILARFDETAKDAHEEAESFRVVTDLAEAQGIFDRACKASCAGVYAVGEKNEVLAVSVTIGDETNLIMQEGFLTGEYLKGQCLNLFCNAEGTLYTSSLKDQLHLLDAAPEKIYDLWNVSEGMAPIRDVQIMAYLLNPLKNDYGIEDVSNEQLGISIDDRTQRFGKLSLSDAIQEKYDSFVQYGCYFSFVAYHAAKSLEDKLREQEMWNLFTDIEMPLLYVLYGMERLGIEVLPDALKEYGDRLTGRIRELENAIHEAAGEDFNINSPKQLGDILFDKMGLPGGKKTKTGYSTAADVLEKLAVDVPFVADILEYRGLAKLKSTYADGLAAYIDENNRIHSTFNQTITATGRISSTEPNLQNIPIRMELGRLIRKVFVPGENAVFVDADYSQVELRILAHMSEDEKLIAAYNSDQDIHKITASQVFGVPLDEVTPQLRRNAKAVNFGIVYGISSFGLGQDLSISTKEANQYIENYFATYPGVKQFIDGLVQSAKDCGYAKTLYGRRRPMPELKESNFMRRQFGERVAMNAPIQGTAADIMKIAMIKVERALRKKGLMSRIVLQVHDELLLECPKEEEAIVTELLAEEMMNAVSLTVNLEVDAHSGETWYDAK